MKRILHTFGFMEVNHASLNYFIDNSPIKECNHCKQAKRYKQKEVALNLASEDPYDAVPVYTVLFMLYLVPE